MASWFSDYAQMAAKKYNKLIKQMKPNVKEYNTKKEEALQKAALMVGSASQVDTDALEATVYGNANSLSFAMADNEPKVESVNKMVKDIHQQ